jgi:hypothetical protein
MFVDVPAPPWMTSTTNCSCSAPFQISRQASTIALAMSGSSRPSSPLASAAASLTAASASIRCGYAEIEVPVMGKFSLAGGVHPPVRVGGDFPVAQ